MALGKMLPCTIKVYVKDQTLKISIKSTIRVIWTTSNVMKNRQDYIDAYLVF